jgi:secondary thiamine-phosphate synthase enzyme
MVHRGTIEVATRGAGFYEVTAELARIVRDSGIADGIAVVFCRHTSASLLIQENADPTVQRDFLAFFERLVPAGDPLFRHDSEGDDDMPAHVKAALTHTSEVIPVGDGAPQLGTWQGLYLVEHRRASHRRRIEVRVLGE